MVVWFICRWQESINDLSCPIPTTHALGHLGLFWFNICIKELWGWEEDRAWVFVHIPFWLVQYCLTQSLSACFVSSGHICMLRQILILISRVKSPWFHNGPLLVIYIYVCLNSLVAKMHVHFLTSLHKFHCFWGFAMRISIQFQLAKKSLRLANN